MRAISKYKGLIYLVGLLIVLPWIIYRVSISKTIKTNHQYKRIQKELVLLQSQSQEEQISDVMFFDNFELQNGDLIVQMMSSDVGSRCTIIKYTPYITESRDGLALHIAELILSGSYVDLVRLIEQTEKEVPYCRLVSASFKSIKQRQHKQAQLHVTLVLQQIMKYI